MDSYYFIGISLLVATVFVAWGVIVYQRASKLERLLRAVLGSQEQVLLLYDENDRLVFDSKGLVFFDRRSRRSIRKLHQKPMPGRELRGDLEIDGNHYRFRSKLLEYKPATFATVVYLSYQGPTNSK